MINALSIYKDIMKTYIHPHFNCYTVRVQSHCPVQRRVSSILMLVKQVLCGYRTGGECTTSLSVAAARCCRGCTQGQSGVLQVFTVKQNIGRGEIVSQQLR